MIVPGLAEVTELAKHYNLIPIARTIMADTETPIRVFHHFHEEEQAFLLESVEGGMKWARYSFIGMHPFITVSGKQGKLVIMHKGEQEEVVGNPIASLKSLLGRYNSPSLSGLPRFTGGAVGFFGYDLLQYYDNVPAHRIDDLQMNDIQFMFCDQVIAFDHVKQQIKVIANVHVEEGATEQQIAAAYEEASHKIDEATARLQRPLPIALTMKQNHVPEEVELGHIHSNVTQEQFESNVEQAKRYIKVGDIEQVVLSQRFEIETDISPLHVYRVLRTMNPSPYMYYLKMGEEIIVGTSPELLVRVEGDRVETRPIAGTRPRGKTAEEDARLERELLADEKELAEHLMLVDLGRNDISKVAKEGSVQLDTFKEIERYSHVMHIVSNVSGQLREDKDFYDAIISCLPAGTVSGAPKKRAIEIIAKLENESRGAYAGAIGYLGFSGNLDTCITIRTIIFKGGKAYVQAGAGIVHDSVPVKEYEESVNKATALLQAIRIAEAMFQSQRNAFESEINQDYFREV